MVVELVVCSPRITYSLVLTETFGLLSVFYTKNLHIIGKQIPFICIFLWIILYFLFLQVLYFDLQAHYNNGEYIIRQGARGDTFYIIAKGKVRSRTVV